MCDFIIVGAKHLIWHTFRSHAQGTAPQNFSWQRGTVELRERSYAIDAIAALALGAAITERSTRSQGGMPYMFASCKQQITGRKYNQQNAVPAGRNRFGNAGVIKSFLATTRSKQRYALTAFVFSSIYTIDAEAELQH